MMLKNKMLCLFLGVLAVSSLQAQVLKVWKNDSATNFNVSTQVDSIAFKSDSLKLFGSGSDVSYSVSGDLDSVTFAEGVHYGSMTDERDGKIYKTVKIGEQTWMAEHLNYGEYLADSNSSSQYQNGAQKFCYDNDEVNCATDGGLYQWHTAMGFDKTCGDGSKTCADQISSGNHQGICPSGWYMPKEAEWYTLVTKLGGTDVAGKKMKLSGFAGDNSSGFSALFAGRRNYVGGFNYQGSDASFWEAEERSAFSGRYRFLDSSDDVLNHYNYIKRYGFSVRCVRGL